MQTELIPYLLSEEKLIKDLSDILRDAIILDDQLKIHLVGQNILNVLDYQSDEILYGNIGILSSDTRIDMDLRESLAKGYFSGKTFKFYSKSNLPSVFTVSGFYLGLISFRSNMIFLSVQTAG